MCSWVVDAYRYYYEFILSAFTHSVSDLYFYFVTGLHDLEHPDVALADEW